MNYNIGRTVFNKRLQSLPLTFRKLVGKLSVPKTLNIGKEIFFELPESKEDADLLGMQWKGQAKDTTYITPCSFDPPIRATQNAKRVKLLCLPIVNPQEAKCFTASDDAAQTLDALLRNLNYFAYTTASSTEDKPELHILVDVRGLTIEQYPDAVKTVAGYLGVTLNEASFKVTQPMYWPSVFRGETTSPIIGYRVNGVPFTSADLNPPDDTDDDEMRQLPVDGVKTDIAREILSFVPENPSYTEWKEVAAALKHQYVDDEATGLKLITEWSARVCPNFEERECARRWACFKPNVKSGNCITLRTLIDVATRRGWRGLPNITKKVYQRINWWLDELHPDYQDAESASILLRGLFSRMSRVPARDALEEDFIIWEASRTIKRFFDVSFSPATIRRLWKNKLKCQVRESYNQAPPKALTGWVFVVYGSFQCFYNIYDNRQLTPSQFNRVHGYDLLVWLNQFYPEVSRKWHIPNLKGNKVLLSQIRTPTKFALNYMCIPVCNGRAYAPEKPTEFIVDIDGVPHLNTYIDSRPGMDEENSELAGKILTTHLERIIDSAKARRHLLDFLAFNVQNPGKKIRHAIYFQGFQGIGKNWLAEMMKKVLGDGNVLVSRIDPLSGWDGWKAGNQLVFFDDFGLPPSKIAKCKAAYKMKEAIVSSDVHARRKFEGRIRVKNVTNYFIFTDRVDPVFISQGQERYYFIESSIKSREQRDRVLPAAYFDKIWDAIQRMPGGFRHFLSHYKISNDFCPNSIAPVSDYQTEVEEEDKPELQIFIEEILSNGSGPLQKDLLSSRALKEALTIRGHNFYSDQNLAEVLRNMGYEKLKRIRLNGDMHYIWKHRDASFDRTPEEEIKKRVLPPIPLS